MTRTLLSLYILIIVSLLGFGALIDQIYSDYLSEQQGETIGYITILESQLDQVNAKLSEASIDESKAFKIINDDLAELFQLDATKSFPLPTELENELAEGKTIILDSDQGLSFHRLTNNVNWILSLGPIPVNQSEESLTDYLLTIIFYLSIALALIVWIRPLTQGTSILSKALNQLGGGQLDTRLHQRSYYLQDLYDDFNATAQRLETASADNQLFSQAVSHDLRTPLARIEFALESLSNNNDGSNLSARIDQIRTDIKQIDSLASELLDYARLGQTRSLELEEINLSIMLHQIIGEYDGSHNKININLDTQDDVVAKIDTRLFYKLIRNLIDNALRFASHTVDIKLLIIDNKLSLEISDDGKGIHPEIIEQIFEPFCRSEKSDKKGHGLGLAICKRVVELHSGKITASNTEQGSGAIFSIMLPAIIQ